MPRMMHVVTISQLTPKQRIGKGLIPIEEYCFVSFFYHAFIITFILEKQKRHLLGIVFAFSAGGSERDYNFFSGI